MSVAIVTGGADGIGWATVQRLAADVNHIALLDLREDAAQDRIYLPIAELQAFGYGEHDLLSGVRNDHFEIRTRIRPRRSGHTENISKSSGSHI